MTKKKVLGLTIKPRAVYLEASVLCKGALLYSITAEMESLQSRCRLLEIPVFIPEVSFLEWVMKRREAVASNVDGANSRIEKLSRVFSYALQPNWLSDKKRMINDTKGLTKKDIEKNEIHLLPIPQGIDVKELVHLSTNHQKPFQEKDRGFRDYMNLRTILEYAKKHTNGPHLLIAEDKVYESVAQEAQKFGVELIVCSSFQEAEEGLIQFVGERIMEYERRQEQLLKDYLQKKKDAISQYIYENSEFSENYIRNRFQSGMLINIMSIDEIRVISIPSVKMSTRFILTRKNERLKISFKANAQITFTAKEIPFTPDVYFKAGQISLSPTSGLTDYLGTGIGTTDYGHERIENRSIKGRFSLEGSVNIGEKKNDKDKVVDKYSGLELESVGPE